MPRAALRTLLALAVAWSATTVVGFDPHLDPTVVPGSCVACHEGHGASRSPMLPAPQVEVCLSCHGSQGRLDRQIVRGIVAPGSRPPFLSAVLSGPYTHPIEPRAFSKHEPGVVTCTSCHSPHRSAASRATGSVAASGRKPSTADPTRFEYQLCQGCHGRGGTGTASLVDIGRLLDPNNRSYHPVAAPSSSGSPSVSSSLAGREINCTDCHGNADPAGPRGPHGSTLPFLLRAGYTTIDGSQESRAAYALCYDCHDRNLVLDSTVFPEHRRHVVDERASCASCHDPHGSVQNRALIRFGEPSRFGAVAASTTTGRLAFVSLAPGSGECYLTCHGKDHAPESYGGFSTD